VFTDILGYAALSRQDEAAALRLVHHHEWLALSQIHPGRNVGSTQDGLLLGFPNGLDAMEHALDLTQHVRDPDTQIPLATKEGGQSARPRPTLDPSVASR